MTVYPSRIDAWLILVLTIAAIVSILVALIVSWFGSLAAFALAALIALVGAGLPLWLLLSTNYTLGEGQLTVRNGPFRWRIPITDISGVTPSSSPLSSPALSLDRLRIEYGKGASLLISPRDKDKFLSDLDAARRGVA